MKCVKIFCMVVISVAELVPLSALSNGCDWKFSQYDKGEDDHSETIYWNPEQTPCLEWHLVGRGNCSVQTKCYIKLQVGEGNCLPEGPYFEIGNEVGWSNAWYCSEAFFSTRLADINSRNLYFKFVAPEVFESKGTKQYAFCMAKCGDYSEVGDLLINAESRPATEAYYMTYDHDELLNERKEEKYFIWPSGNITKKNEAFWNVFGVRNCTIGIQCTISFDGNCATTGVYVEVSDGIEGKQIYCGNLSFAARPSDMSLQDMFLKVNSPPGEGHINLKCSSKCDFNLEYMPLPKTNFKRTDMRCVCGIQNNDDRILGGEVAHPNEFPWQVALVYRNTRQLFCGGSVINDRLILTARHCVTEYKMDVLIHVHTQMPVNSSLSLEEIANLPIDPTILKLDKTERTQRFQVVDYIAPIGLYGRINIFEYDIALLVLDQKINLVDPDGPTPVCLPPASAHTIFNNALVGKTLLATGWGWDENREATKELHKVDLPFSPPEQCQKQFEYFDEVWTERIMCTLAPNQTSSGVKNTCKGDSGGCLLFNQNDNQFVQVGLVSGGVSTIVDDCADTRDRSVYTKTSYFAQWIQFYSNIWGAKWCKEDF